LAVEFDGFDILQDEFAIEHNDGFLFKRTSGQGGAGVDEQAKRGAPFGTRSNNGSAFRFLSLLYPFRRR
jgi:hypothetical protein